MLSDEFEPPIARSDASTQAVREASMTTEPTTDVAETRPDGDGQVSAPRFAVEVVRNLAIPVGPGGVQLAADLYRPIGAGPRPALVTLLPYHKDGQAGSAGWYFNHYFAARGYPSLLVDFRGLGSSGGQPRPPLAADEAHDGVTTVDWVAQQEWCDGNVGMWGVSYGAITSLRTASLQPAALKAIVPIMGHVRPGPDFVHPDGARGGMASLGIWGLETLLFQLMPPLHFDEHGSWERRWRDRLEHAQPYLLDLHQHGPDDAAWDDRAIDVSKVAVPSFCVGGWRDLFCAGLLDAYERISGPKRLLVGPWMHTQPDMSPFHSVDLVPMMCQWWDRWLLGDDDGVDDQAPITVFVQGRQAWHHLDSWPPRDIDPLTLDAEADGSLVATRNGSGVVMPRPDAVLARTVDPTVGILSGLCGLPSPGFGLPLDQHDDDMRSLCFTSEPLTATVQITGRPAATIRLADESAEVTTLVVKLTDVDPRGRSMMITSGTRRLADPPADGHRRDPGVVRVTLTPTNYEVPSGHRLRLVVAGADFPRVWPDPIAGTLAVSCGGDPDAHAATSITVPVLRDLPHTDATIPAPDPETRDAMAALRVYARPEWTVQRDYIGDNVTMTLGQDAMFATPEHEHLVQLTSSVTGHVSRTRPDLARMTGVATAVIDPGTADAITVHAETVLTRQTATATGSVEMNGATVFERRWAS
jgi:uncharacterized protein